MKSPKKIRILIITAAVVLINTIVIATNRNEISLYFFSANDKKTPAVFSLDEADLKNAELADVLLKQLSGIKTGRLMTADFIIMDSAEKSNSVNLQMELWMKDSLIYQKMGSADIINLPDIFLQVDHQRRKIVVTDPIKITEHQLSLYDNIIDLMNEEFFKTSYQIKNNRCYISFKNDSHVSFPYFEMGYNCNDTTISSIKMSKRKEITIDYLAPVVNIVYENIRFTDFDFKKKMNYQQYVHKKSGNWQLQEQYKTYELTVI